jgi:hypothetical protein
MNECAAMPCKEPNVREKLDAILAMADNNVSAVYDIKSRLFIPVPSNATEKPPRETTSIEGKLLALMETLQTTADMLTFLLNKV